ncbi:MAG: hypothetical protein QOF98_1317, partial [Streptomyces sp.]|nr:hypothetical protein [Streptomyces sp.]
RHPALIQQVREAFPYPPDVRRALDALQEEGAAGVIESLPGGAYGSGQWAAWGRDHVGRSWFDVPFLWAESYFYRRLLGAVGYFAAGPWRGIDPFGPVKRAELRGAAVTAELAVLDEVARLPREAQDTAVLHGALWGNRADLGFQLSGGGAVGSPGPADQTDPTHRPSQILVDDAPHLWQHLNTSPPGPVHLIADNAGRELIADLILIDHLLRTGRATTVVLHLKPYPYFVSDATTADAVDCLRRIAEAPGRAGEIGARLWQAMGDGRLELRTHPFSCAPLPYADMPADLRADLSRAALLIFKGDLNYRRLVGDCDWPPTTPFAAPTSYLPAATPVLALRTLKSDVVTGLDPRTLAALDATGEPWRTTGAHALIQFRP